jgi:nicotinate dehydrogenase subunit B
MSNLPANLAANPLLTRWVTIDAADTITVRSGKVELGQGIATAMAAIAAKELGLTLDQIRVEAASTAQGPDEGYTAGSFSVEHGGSAMRTACAMVRTLFEQRAASLLGTDAASVNVSSGVFSKTHSNDGVSYWRLRGDVDLNRSATDLPLPLLRSGPVDQGPLQRTDLPAKFSGAAFIQDLRMPGMLYGRVLRPAHPKARLLSVDAEVIKAQPGVAYVVVDGGFVGVVAARDEDAVHAITKAAKTAKWTRTAELPAFDGTNGWMAGVSPRSSAAFVEDAGDVPPAHQHHSASYSRPYLAHAAIGPSCAVAVWSDPGAPVGLQVWSHSQGIYPLRRQIARTFGLDNEAVQVTHVNATATTARTMWRSMRRCWRVLPGHPSCACGAGRTN